MNSLRERLSELLRLSRELGSPRHGLAILAEGNTSTRLDAKTFLVKASGSNLATLDRSGVVQCRSGALLEMLDRRRVGDDEVEAALMSCRTDPRARKPSVEALFHAWLLTLPGAEYVGHTHAPAVNSILCSRRAGEFAEKRIFPDEIVCCDTASVFVPYTDPGLRLAQAIRERTGLFVRKHGRIPRLVLMQNHGLIALGRTPEAVLAATWMAEKAARIWLGAAALGGPVFLKPGQVRRIAGRPDEKKRRDLLKL